MSVSDVLADLRADTAARTPRGRRGLWLSFLGAYGLEILLGPALGSANGSGAERALLPDWLGVDLQHGELELRDLFGLLRVSERAGLPLLARMPSHDAGDIGKALDAGVDGVIIPLVESAAQAADLVRAVRKPPHGARSSGATRDGFGFTTAGEPLLLPMVETRAGLEAADAIVGTDGVDGIFVGPYDLSVSLGASPTDDSVLAAIADAVSRARAIGKVAGMYAGLPELVALAPTLDLIAVDSDITVVRRGFDAVLRDAGEPG